MTDRTATDRTADPRSTTTDMRSTTGLLSDAANHVTGLFRKEIDLVRAELSESATRAGVGAGMVAGGVVFVLVALNVLSAALVAGIAEMGVDAGWAALIVGVIYLIIALIMVRMGTERLKAANFAPKRTAENIRRDAQAVKETFNGQR